jgi:hypothetical protein
MGDVFEAYDHERAATVALKTLTRLDAAGVYQLKNEFRALAGVSDPNLVRLYELFGEGDTWFFTMELVDGVPFDRWVRTGTPEAPEGTSALDESRLRGALAQLIAAVDTIHRAGKLHRDLKPTNVLVTEQHRVVVLDFGLAVDPQPGGVGDTLTENTICGTPNYMAPEQAAGARATPESDYYAIGVMLFEALTARLPFAGTPYEVLVDKQRNAAPAPSAFASAVPADLEAWTRALLERDPASRPDAHALRSCTSTSQLAAPRQAASPADRVAADSKLLGREAELRMLREAYATTRQHRPVAFFVAGESGIGKSALVDALLAELRAQHGAVILAGRCYERENVPYKAFDALVDALSRHLRALAPEDAAALLPRDVFSLARLFPVLNRVNAVANAPRRHVPDRDELQQRAFSALSELFGRLRDSQPLILFIDDVHWLDRDSARLLQNFLRDPDLAPLLLIVAHRSEGASDNPLLQSVRTAAHDNRTLEVLDLRLGPLDQSALEALIRRRGQLDENRAQALAQEAHGSPFFASELALATTSADSQTRALTLEEAVERRVGALSETARRVLLILAFAGQPVTAALVSNAAGIIDVRSDLDVLRDERLVRVGMTADGVRTVECYHDKIREIVAARLPGEQTREIAGLLARALLCELDAEPELITRCLLGAGRPALAADHAATGAERALRALAFDRAARLYGLALQHGSFDAPRRRQLLAERAEALGHAGHGESAIEAHLRARSGAGADEALQLTRKAGAWAVFSGHSKRGRALFAEALQPLGIKLPESPAYALAALVWARSRLWLRGLQVFAPKEDHDPATLRRLEALRHASFTLIGSDQIRGSYFAALHTSLALESGHALELAHALGLELLVAVSLQTPKKFVDAALELAAELCEQTGDPSALQTFHVGRGAYRLFRTGNFEGALSDWESALQTESAPAWFTLSYDRPTALCFKSHSLFLLGRLSEASRLIRVHFEEALTKGKFSLLPHWMWLSGLVLPAVGDHELAQRRLTRAIDALVAANSDRSDSSEMMLLGAEVSLALYSGEARRGWNATEASRQRLRRSLFAGFSVEPTVETMWCGLAAEVARTSAAGPDRTAMLREVERCAARTHGALRVQPALACARGDVQAAVRALRAMVERPKSGPLFGHAARRRLGVLLGGQEGARLVNDADAFLTRGGVSDPERYVRMLLPGVEFA